MIYRICRCVLSNPQTPVKDGLVSPGSVAMQSFILQRRSRSLVGNLSRAEREKIPLSEVSYDIGLVNVAWPPGGIREGSRMWRQM